MRLAVSQREFFELKPGDILRPAIDTAHAAQIVIMEDNDLLVLRQMDIELDPDTALDGCFKSGHAVLGLFACVKPPVRKDHAFIMLHVTPAAAARHQ